MGLVASPNEPSGPWPLSTVADSFQWVTMLLKLAPQSRRTRRYAALFAALVFAGLCVSAAHLTIPGLKEATRATAPASRSLGSSTRWRTRMAVISGRSTGARPVPIRAFRWVVAWLYSFPHLAKTAALDGRAPGADAHFGGPRRARWAVLGGHGRLGPGARL